MKTKLLCLIFLVCGVAMQAQQVIATAGNFSSNTSGSLSWTIGEGIIETYTGTGMILTQGFQQSTRTSTATQNLSSNAMEISAYPNPTSDFVSLKVNIKSPINLKFSLYDVYGKLVLDQKLESNESKISFNNLASGVYLLKLFSYEKEIKAIKIIKN
jgi:hypothetical protein